MDAIGINKQWIIISKKRRVSLHIFIIIKFYGKFVTLKPRKSKPGQLELSITRTFNN